MKRSLLNQRNALAGATALLVICSMLPAAWAQAVSRSPRHLVEWVSMGLSHPVRFVATRLYSPQPDGETIESLRGQRDEYHRLAYKLMLMLEDERERNSQFHQMRDLFGDFSNQRFVAASVAYGSSDFNQTTLRINRGKRDGLEAGQVVSHGAQLVGRIVDAGPSTATVGIITSPRTSLKVRIVPPGPGVGGAIPRQTEAIVEVTPDGKAFTGIVDANREVRQGDIAFLADNAWPRDGFIVGKVANADTSPNDPLRVVVRVEPERPLHLLGSVTVLVPVKPAGASDGRP